MTEAELAAMLGRDPDDNGMHSACGEYNCPCHYDLPRLVAALRASEAARIQLSEMDAKTFVDLRLQLAAAEQRLPKEMPNCTILFKECERGHGWLTAKNWVQHGCPTCELRAAEQRAKEAEAKLAEAREACTEAVDVLAWYWDEHYEDASWREAHAMCQVAAAEGKSG